MHGALRVTPPVPGLLPGAGGRQARATQRTPDGQLAAPDPEAELGPVSASCGLFEPSFLL